ncbi:hypothetical protein NP493_778g00001 [Ridgeia piscesae]|uniref:Uncharacterized protein n=1 Tax=Ridgeia piscesae TaxID=27915 RepID=A0AAD9KP32_RIDPI|nr:hypothetical protein NP493_778g00001 [Ridgeia piscesae]
METDIPIYVNNPQIENVEIYLRQRYNTSDKNQDMAIQRRITAGWIAFAKHRDIFKGNTGTCLKRQVYTSCILPAMTYGMETWALTTYSRGARGRSGHLVLCLVALSFSKFQTFLNNIPEGNPLKSVYLTPKIAFTFRPMWSLNGRVAYISLTTFSQ